MSGEAANRIGGSGLSGWGRLAAGEVEDFEVGDVGVGELEAKGGADDLPALEAGGTRVHVQEAGFVGTAFRRWGRISDTPAIIPLDL